MRAICRTDNYSLGYYNSKRSTYVLKSYIVTIRKIDVVHNVTSYINSYCINNCEHLLNPLM